MNGRVQLKLGDMFDGPSDLIVLPCSTGGNITQFVWNKLQMYELPEPPSLKPLGHVEIMPLYDAENLAQYIAYGYSVYRNTSDSAAIEKIGEALGEFTSKNESVKIISVPLLGAGAGGLNSEDVVSSLKKGFLSGSAVDSKLVIHVLSKSVFDNLTNMFSSERPKKQDPAKENSTLKEPLRVFISYTKTNDEHQKWVESIGIFLRQNGVNARLDVWHLRMGMDLPQFMTNELMLADRVLILSNEKYAAKANGRHGGVGWESMIIQGDMSKLPPDSTKYLAIVKCEDINNGLPDYLKSKYVIHWKNDSHETHLKQTILRELLFAPKEPILGVAPMFI